MVSSALSALDGLTEDRVGQAMTLLDVSDLGGILVLDDEQAELYRTVNVPNAISQARFQEYIASASEGNDVFYSRYENGVFRSCCFSPVMYRGTVTGIVFVYELDSDLGSLLSQMSDNLIRFSVAIAVAAIVAVVIVSTRLMSRIKTVLNGIKNVREGEYTVRVDVHGRDEIRLLGDEFNSLTDRLQNTEEIRRRFVADASHELKTPLASILLLSDSILQNDGIDQTTVREFVSDIARESQRLARITERLLSLTRLDNVRQADHNPVRVSEVVDSALRMLRPIADSRNIHVEADVEPSCVVMATYDDLYQVLFNLAENAVKYNVDGGSVTLRAVTEGNEAILTVSDTGIGIPEADLPHIFDRFYRVDKARSREAGGTGLGLSIVRDTVLLHGGTITTEKNEGPGMTFRVTFPAYHESTD